MTATYQEFLARKSQAGDMEGFEPLWLPDWLFDFQRHLVEWAIYKGRAAIFADCGLGKTPLSLVWASNVVRRTNRPVLILTPLAVSQQFVREGEKFGIEVGVSRDGKPAGPITALNYERLHKADEADYSGVVCDECFAVGTSVDVVEGRGICQKHIEKIQPGDIIWNAAGVDRVVATHSREVDRATRVVIDGSEIYCSASHPFFTSRGWIGSSSLRPGDAVLQTGEAVRMVRNGLYAEVPGVGPCEVLRTILLSEMADEYFGAQSEGAYARGRRETGESEEPLAKVGDAGGEQGNASDYATVPNERPEGQEETIRYPSSDWAQTEATRRQRSGAIGASAIIVGLAREGLGVRGLRVVRETTARVSDALQAGHRQPATQDRDRVRWSCAPLAEAPRPKKGQEAVFSRVDSVEVLELGDTRLDQFRSADRKLRFYDIEAERHPSFSVSGVLVHNSSILKHWAGKTQKAVTRFMAKMQYRLLCTATPAPNDFVELGTSSEALGMLTHSAMLETFFRQVSDDEKKKKATKMDIIHSKRLSWRVIQSIGQWALKAHAFEPFWRWVSFWARACSKPSDLGPYDDSRFELPPLNRIDHMVVPKSPPPGYLFTIPAFGLNQERSERRRTIGQRAELVADLVQINGHGKQQAVVWCQLNDEADAIAGAIPDAIQVKGTQSIDAKEELIQAFLNGQARILVTKAKIAGLGLNMQNCAHVITFVDHSYEKFYQSIRRCWRFGQKRPVRLDVICTEGEINVKRNMDRKQKLAEQMFESIIAFMNDTQGVTAKVPTLETEVPPWMFSTAR